MSQKVKVAVIGCGHLGKWHVDKAYHHDNCELIAVVDPHFHSQAMVKEKYPEVEVFHTLEECIDNIDAAIIATPTSFHFAICEQLLAAGKHIFCEKPMTQTGAEAQSLLKKALENNLVFQVGHSERCHNIWSQKKDWSTYLEKDCLVQIRRIAAFKGRATDVGVVRDLMIHDVDILLQLFGEVPLKVEAKGLKVMTSAWDHVEACLEFSHNRRAFITASRSHAYEKRDVEICSKAGTIAIDLMNTSFYQSDKTGKVISGQYEKRDHLLVEQDEFYRCILTGEKPQVDAQVGTEVVLILDQILKALG